MSILTVLEEEGKRKGDSEGGYDYWKVSLSLLLLLRSFGESHNGESHLLWITSHESLDNLDRF
jgi:hypothetical protein